MYESFLAIELKNKINDQTLLISSCYLPPKYSPWGRDSESLFACVLNYIYTKDVEHLIICGDFNSRIGSLNEVIDNTDYVRKRADIDFHVNQHRRSLIEFLQEARFCVLNGRFVRMKMILLFIEMLKIVLLFSSGVLFVKYVFRYSSNYIRASKIILSETIEFLLLQMY